MKRARHSPIPGRSNPQATVAPTSKDETGQSRTFQIFEPREVSAFFIGLVLALVLQQGFGKSRASVSVSRDTPAAFAIQSAQLTPAAEGANKASTEAADTSRPSQAVAALLAVEARSPFGVPSAGVSTQRAMELAENHLRGLNGAAQSRLEANYWLKHALGPVLRDPSLTWALSQLGSVYAAPDVGLPDFKAASTAWQIAASLGDPVAHCFLARMYELGTGVEKDPETARRLYGLALTAGGCPGLMQALGRLN